MASDGDRDMHWIWDAARARIIWASEPALAFWGETSVAELAARPFDAQDPNTRAMAFLVDRALGAPLSASSEAPRHAPDIILFPKGAPIAVDCDALVRTGGGEKTDGPGSVAEGRTLLAVKARRRDAEAVAGDLFDRAMTPIALIRPNGAPIRLNAAATRLLQPMDGDASNDPIFDKFRPASEVRRCAETAMHLGVSVLSADLLTLAPPERTRLSFKRVSSGPDGAVALLLEAQLSVDGLAPPRSARTAPTNPRPGDRRMARLIVDPKALQVRDADATARRLLNLPDAGAAPTDLDLAHLFPRQAAALEEAARRIASDPSHVARLNLPLGVGLRRGPWAEGALFRADADTGLTLTLLDLGPERRSLLRARFAQRRRDAASDALGVGVLLMDTEGRIRRASRIARELLGLDTALATSPSLLACVAAQDRPRLRAHLADTPRRKTEAPRWIQVAPAADNAADTHFRLAASPDLGAQIGWRAVAVTAAEPSHETTRLTPADLHRVRTALTSIQGFAEMLRDAQEPPDADRRGLYLQDIVDSAAELLDAFCAMARAAPQPSVSDLGAASTPAPDASDAAQPPDAFDLSRLLMRAAQRNAAVEAPSQPDPAVAARLSTPQAQRDVEEAVQLLVQTAASNGAIQLSAGPRANDGARSPRRAAITITTEVAVDAWPPTTWRVAELLIERAGGDLIRKPRRGGSQLRVSLPAA